MMYIDNEVLEKMIMTMVEGFNRLEKKLDRMNRLKDCLDGDYQTDENGKNFYRSSEIQDFLRQRGKKK